MFISAPAGVVVPPPSSPVLSLCLLGLGVFPGVCWGLVPLGPPSCPSLSEPLWQALPSTTSATKELTLSSSVPPPNLCVACG